MSNSIWDWPIDQFLNALIESGLLDRSNPRPCRSCETGIVYGGKGRKICLTCYRAHHYGHQWRKDRAA